MKFQEYIELLSESKLKKENFDKVLWFSPVVPKNTAPYEQAVLDWYRWSIKDYNTEYKTETKIDTTATMIISLTNKVQSLD